MAWVQSPSGLIKVGEARALLGDATLLWYTMFHKSKYQ
jgi:hypothetical protein